MILGRPQKLIWSGKRNQCPSRLPAVTAHFIGAEALALGDTLVDWLNASLELHDQRRRPQGVLPNDQGGETVNCLVNADPDKPRNAQ